MKTSVIEVHDMLSVFSVDEVEKRIGEVPGVQSVTVNFSAGNATVRYDETQLEASDIKSAVRQRGYASADEPPHEGDHNAKPATPAATAPNDDASDAGPKPAATAATANSPAGDDKDKAEPDAPPSTPTADASKVSAPPPAVGHAGHAAPGAATAMSADMAHEMGHGGKDLDAMVRDMRNRFWICLIFTVPIFVYAPMGGMWQAPAPPFGLELNLWLVLLRKRRDSLPELAVLRLRLARA